MNETKKRILFLISRFLDGGIDTVLVEYIRFLSKNTNYEITLAIGTNHGELEVFHCNLPDNIKIIHLAKSDWLTKWRRKRISGKVHPVIKLYDETVLTPIRRIIIQKGINKLSKENDVIIDFDCCFYSFLKNITIKKIAFFHFSFSKAIEQNPRRLSRIKQHFHIYDNIIVISKEMLKEAVTLFPENKEKFRLIYNAKHKESVQSLANENVGNVLINEPFILAIERFEEILKDVSTILRAFSILKKEFNRPEKLYLIGKGKDEEKLKMLAKELGIADNVIFLGFMTNPFPWLKRAQLLVHSAKSEGLPTVLVEGLMLNKLIVATDCPTGPREILNDGKAGLLTPVGDPQAMAQAIDKLLTDKELQKNILQGVEEHSYNFTFEKIEKELTALF